MRCALATLALAAEALAAAPAIGAQGMERERGWSLQVSIGAPLNLPTPVTIRQGASPDLRFTARWETRPFEPPLYYAVRIGRWDRAGAWEIELVHHKLYLAHPPTEVQRFDVSHGFNLLLVNRAIAVNGVVLRGGPGVVVAHPENTVRQLPLPPNRTLLGGGYHVAGPALQFAAGRRWDGPGPLRLGVEAKVTGAWVRVPVASGRASVPNVALHALAGVGLGP